MSSKARTIFRVIKSKDFTQISNGLLHDKRLSLKTKGLICIMLSLPDSWDFRREHLLSLSSDGKDALSSAINEGRKFGYITMGTERDKAGKITKWIMEVFESPVSLVAEEVYPEAGFPLLDKPDLGNPPLSNTKRTINTKEQQQQGSVVEKLFDSGNQQIARFVLSELLEKYTEQEIQEQLSNLRHSTGINNPAAWLRKALERRYAHSSAPANVTHISPASYELWTPELQSRLNKERDALTDPNDWREELVQSRLKK